MSDFDIDNLKYLALEGGGAKGAVYVGAIEALEELYGVKENNGSILDAKEKDGKSTKIKGIAGTSAGSITAFALALGLNSKQFGEVLKYDFKKNFLSEEDDGKYRMVGVDEKSGQYKLLIGEDDDGKLGGKKEKFTYEFNKYANIKDNNVSFALRSSVILLIVNVLFDGVINQLDTLFKIFNVKGISDFVNKKIDKNILSYVLDPEYLNAARTAGKPFIYWLVLKLLNIIFKKKLHGLSLSYSKIGNLFCDCGMFSGVKVREFFYDLVIYAATRDTHFQRCLISHYNSLGNDVSEKNFKCLNKFEIGYRHKTDFNQDFKAKAVLVNLQHLLTFKFFYEVTGIDFGLCVTNYSSDSSLYFSHKHTPDYPVLEALSASMNIPGVFKPLYSEADVFIPKGYNSKNIKSKVKVEINGKTKEETYSLYNKKGEFDNKVYGILESAVKKYLTRYSLEKKLIRINTNTEINEDGYLSILKDVVFSNEVTTRSVKFDRYEVNITKEILVFFYNTVYKGLLVDGGVTNNIPYNYFRSDVTGELEGVLALKLDSEFPNEIYDSINPEIIRYLKEDERIDELPNPMGGNISNNNEIDQRLRRNNSLMDKKLNAILTRHTNNKVKTINPGSYERLKEKLIERYEDNKGFSPWNKPKGIFGIAGTLQYGSEHGQVHFYSDHENLIPLYTYGITTMDFDLDKLKSLVEISQIKSKEAVKKYFS